MRSRISGVAGFEDFQNNERGIFVAQTSLAVGLGYAAGQASWHRRGLALQGNACPVLGNRNCRGEVQRGLIRQDMALRE